MKTKVNILVGILVGSFFIWLAVRGTDLRGIQTSFKSAHYLYVIPVTLLSIIVLFLRSYRWGVLLKPLEKIDQWSLFTITTVGFMAVNLLPVRLGEFVRPYLISQKSSIKIGSSLATIVVERIFDMLTLMVVLLVIVTRVKLPGWIFRSACSLILILLPFFLVLIFLAVKRELTARGIDRILSKVPHSFSSPLMKVCHSFLDGLQVLPDPKKVVYLSLFSVAIWGLVGVATYTLFPAFTSTRGLPLVAAFVVLTITVLGITLPTAPGFVGNYHFSCVLALTFFGVPKTDALTFAITLHAIQVLVTIILGLLFLPFMNLSLLALFQGSKTINAQKNDLDLTDQHAD